MEQRKGALYVDSRAATRDFRPEDLALFPAYSAACLLPARSCVAIFLLNVSCLYSLS